MIQHFFFFSYSELRLVTNATEKKHLREKDQKLREDIEHEVSKLYIKHKDDNKAFYERQKALAEKELELIDKTLERSTTSTNIFGEQITKTYKPNDKRKKELQETIKTTTKKIAEASDYSRLGAVVQLAKQLTSWNPYDQNDSSPFFDPEWMFGITKQDIGYFDVLIGNPPYLRIQGIRDDNPAFADLLVSKYEAATGSFDLYSVFAECAINLVTRLGVVNFIMPVKWTNAAFGKGLRTVVSRNSFTHKIINFGAYQVFNASTYTGLQWFRYDSSELTYYELDKDLASNQDLAIYLNSLDSTNAAKIDSKKLKADSWVLTVGETTVILNKLNKQPRRVKDVFERIFCGLQTSRDDVYFLYNCREQGETIVGYSKYLETEIEIERNLVKPLLKGDDVHRYEKITTDKFVIFPYRLPNANLYTEEELSIEFPLGHDYLKKCENALRGREKGRLLNDDFWYRYIYPKNLVLFANEKLVAPDISLGGNFSLDLEGKFYQTTTIYGYIKKSKIKESYKYWNAILNSQLCWWFLINTGTVLANGYFRFKPDYINLFPIPETISSSLELKITSLVDKIIIEKEAYSKVDTSKLEQEIDNRVYRLYDLTYEEVKVIDPNIESKISEAEYNAISID